MPDNKVKHSPTKKSSDNNDEIEELKNFIKMKKVQTVALKKIMAKLNTDDNQTSNK